MKREPTQKRAKDTIGYIRTAASRILTNQPYHAASTNEIARLAGVSIGSIYQYFENKDDIFEDLIENDMNSLLGKLKAFRFSKSSKKSTILRNYILLGTQNDHLNTNTYHELEKQDRFRPLIRDYSISLCAEVSSFLRRLDVEIEDNRITPMAELILLCAQSIGRRGVEGEVPADLLEEYLTMIDSYVLNTYQNRTA